MIDPDRPSDPIVIIDDPNYWTLPNLLGNLLAAAQEDHPEQFPRDEDSPEY
ncbi:hypothetical protein H6G33_09490 [Calothrix sp. FACHB-1219]|uniref:hypothetical protein n=1 Tax=unclassified Calothrix TaxID=2619626 RepID=UPI001682919E|nr:MULTISPECIES: hypothetical protein [unclassified Calothrix]MBD2201579.1 hypothetical protein [Calothrix sp. FACHB-168]MBD2217265.1 hypothetical protein [Calothrix sp. FACHB-1219]